MALTFRTRTIYNSTASTFATLNKPTGTTEGDMLFAVITRGGDTSQPSAVPDGWLLVPGTTYHDVGSLDYVALYYKVAGDSEPDNYTWSWVGSYRTVAQINCCYGDFDPENIFGSASDTVYSTSDAIIRANSFEVTNPDSHILCFTAFLSGLSDQVPSAPTVPDDFTKVSHWWGSFIGIDLNYLEWTGSEITGNIDSTMAASNTSKHAFAVALNPAPQIQTDNGLFFGMGFI